MKYIFQRLMEYTKPQYECFTYTICILYNLYVQIVYFVHFKKKPHIKAYNKYPICLYTIQIIYVCNMKYVFIQL